MCLYPMHPPWSSEMSARERDDVAATQETGAPGCKDTSLQQNTQPGWWFGTMEFYDFPYIGNIIIPIDSIIFQRGRSLQLFAQLLAEPC